MTTKRFLVAILREKTANFDDETYSRHHFEVKKALFWRRASFPSPFLVGKLHFLATRPVLVANFDRAFNDKVSWY
ncbi:hypothetical protein [Caldibacillus thermoamylovorans]|uniref:hypothetical protein n=1 Tax=Caldibacillus thermoamylovorans TaxID=35841 RepID=UPI00203EFD5B|nr:hypothetical protein [Caldibacillus thermoamylovorans]MCM3477971.1 hypothetical protein [Caldibacillus thermoamylovorans]